MRLSPENLPDEISITWHISDIKDINDKLSVNDCREILQILERTHDATIGINWEVIETAVYNFLNDKE